MNSYSLYSGTERRTNNSLAYRGRERRSSTWSQALVQDEPTLIRQAVARNREAFARLYDRYVTKIFKFVYYQVGSANEAQDVTSRVFHKAWETMHTHATQEGAFAGWLYRIAQIAIADRERARPEPYDSGKTPLAIEHAGHDQRQARIPLTPQALREVIHLLPAEEQQVVILRFVQGLSADQVAQVLGRPPEAIRALQYRALANLNGALGPE
jgi:RNA polymerase sigma-70 factor, ECF subfamily